MPFFDYYTNIYASVQSSIFTHFSVGVIKQLNRLIKRHLETWSTEKTRLFGEGAEGARKKAESNDMLNAVMIEQWSKPFADRIIVSVDE